MGAYQAAPGHASHPFKEVSAGASPCGEQVPTEAARSCTGYPSTQLGGGPGCAVIPWRSPAWCPGLRPPVGGRGGAPGGGAVAPLAGKYAPEKAKGKHFSHHISLLFFVPIQGLTCQRT